MPRRSGRQELWMPAGKASARLVVYAATAEGSRRALCGQRRFARRSRHAHLLVSPEGCKDSTGSFTPISRSATPTRPPACPLAAGRAGEKDLIEMFRHYSELSGGPFPNFAGHGVGFPDGRDKALAILRAAQKSSAKEEQEIGGSPGKASARLEVCRSHCRRKPTHIMRAKAFRSARPTRRSSGTARRMQEVPGHLRRSLGP